MTAELEQKIGYTFKHKALLRQALTHSSLTSDIHCNYERLEFLGDRILGVTVAEILLRTFGNEPEGALAPRFVELVRKETVAEIMRGIGVNRFVRANNKEVQSKDNVLCDVGEALIAAIYLDSGDMRQAATFVKRFWEPMVDKASAPHKDYKTKLQEAAVMHGRAVPHYEVVEKTGAEHAPHFCVRVTAGDDASVLGEGPNKKAAEQEAAKKLLEQWGIKND